MVGPVKKLEYLAVARYDVGKVLRRAGTRNTVNAGAIG